MNDVKMEIETIENDFNDLKKYSRDKTVLHDRMEIKL